MTVDTLQIPSIDFPALIANFKRAADTNPLLKKTVAFCETGRFVDDNGKVDDVGTPTLVSLELAALIHFLVQHLNPDLTIETGFGGGSSSCVFVGVEKTLRAIVVEPGRFP